MKIRTGRLRRLAKHLRSKHLTHKKFRISIFAKGKLNEYGNYCGSAGCAIGELPAVWPKEWSWVIQTKNIETKDIHIVHKKYGGGNSQTWNAVSKFFSIDWQETYHLFYADRQVPLFYGGKRLDFDATAIEVADNIIAFIEKVAS